MHLKGLGIERIKLLKYPKYVKTITAVSSTMLTYKPIFIRFVSFYVLIYEKKVNKV